MEAQPFHENYYRILEAFATGRVRRVMITMPPQHGKSHGASVLLPSYLLGLDPDRKIAIASYSSSLASRFNRRVQRLIDSREYAQMFPETTIKSASGRPSRSGGGRAGDSGYSDAGYYIRTADHVEIIGAEGELFSVGREGPLTGNRVDTFILDDLYKDSMEANSPVVRDNCWDWYTSVVRTRMHNDSSEIIVNTRWHEEDLIGMIASREEVRTLTSWSELDSWPPDVWLHLNWEALKSSEATEIDPREGGEALWPVRQSRRLLLEKRRLDPIVFNCMYQGAPSSSEGLLYGEGFKTYKNLTRDIVSRENYTDTADMGDDYLCSVSYVMGRDGLFYVTDVIHTPDPMEVTEKLVADMLIAGDTRVARIESNNGGRGFSRAVKAILDERSLMSGGRVGAVRIDAFHQSDNKEARILTNSATVMHRIRMPVDWAQRWPRFYTHLTTYRRKFNTNRWHDAADTLTGIVERGGDASNRKTFRLLRC
jgi:predicted phage terminase large subunit-like protein